MSNIVLDLGKKFELELSKVGFSKIPTFQTRIAIDKSGSMSQLYRQGFVDKVVELFMGVANKFDDNGELEYTFFNRNATSMKSVKLNSYKSLLFPNAEGGTAYNPPLEELTSELYKTKGIFSSIFGKAETNLPIYIAFLTDGQPDDKHDFERCLENLKNTNKVFIQFITLGNDVPSDITKIMNSYENTALLEISNPMKLNEDDLYSKLANTQLLNWVTKVGI